MPQSEVRILAAEVLAEGFADGPVHVLHAADDPDAANARDPEALEQARQAVLMQLARAAEGAADEHRAILEAQALMLDDPGLIERVRSLLSERGAKSAVLEAAAEAAQTLAALDDPYLQARAQDVREVAELWTQALSGAGPSTPSEPAIAVAEDLPVGWLLSLPPGRILGALVLRGAPTMHAAIVARNLGFPLLRLREAPDFHRASQARRLRLDGAQGLVALDPPDQAARPRSASAPVVREVVQAFGEPLQVRANVASIVEAEAALDFGCDGVGLLRSELSFAAAGHPLSEAEQLALYRAVAKALDGRPLTVRTLDAGADKPLPGITVPGEANPQLGVRGVRLMREHPELLQTQLRALWQAAATSPVEVMVPMVGRLADWQFALEQARSAEESLRRDALPFRRPPFGMMLEVPSALAQVADFISAGVDFFSIGTNDLAQYVYATDRENPRESLPRAPLALFRMLLALLAPAREANIPIAVCGEMAGDPLLLPLLLLVGARELSVAGARVPQVKETVARIGQGDWRARAERLLRESHDDESLERGLAGLA